jgi:hypothetical protein
MDSIRRNLATGATNEQDGTFVSVLLAPRLTKYLFLLALALNVSLANAETLPQMSIVGVRQT